MKSKIAIIGWDGATWDILYKFVNKGIMPNLKERMKKGAHGVLNSCVPPITAPAWASIMTGKSPGNHNIYEFFNTDNIWTNSINNSNSIRSETIWDILSKKGYNHILSGIPLSFPFKKIKGIQIADFLIPEKNSLSHPSDILKIIEKKFGPYLLWPSEVYYPGNEENILDECIDFIKYHNKVQNFLFDNYEWDVFFYYHNILDRFQHELWHLIDETHPFYSKSLANKYELKINTFFKFLDKTININKFNSIPLIVLSDHGFGPNKHNFSVNHQLLEKKLIQLKKTPLHLFKRLLYNLGFTPLNIYNSLSFFHLSKFRLSRYRGKLGNSLMEKASNLIFINSSDIDKKKSLFFSKGNYGQIYCLRKNYDIEKMKTLLMNVFDEFSHLIKDIKHKNEIYKGKFIKNAPDFTILLNDYSYNLNSPSDFMINKTTAKIDRYFMPGAHRQEGVILVNHDNIKKNYKLKADITDFAPTALYLLNEYYEPNSFDGSITRSIFTEMKKTPKPNHSIDESKYDNNKNQHHHKDDKNQILLNRLKSLGYI